MRFVGNGGRTAAAAAAAAATAARGGVKWIDDARREGATHSDVPVSPASRRPTTERPPGASYSSLALSAGWAPVGETLGGTVAVAIPSPGGHSAVPGRARDAPRAGRGGGEGVPPRPAPKTGR